MFGPKLMTQAAHHAVLSSLSVLETHPTLGDILYFDSFLGQKCCHRLNAKWPQDGIVISVWYVISAAKRCPKRAV